MEGKEEERGVSKFGKQWTSG